MCFRVLNQTMEVKDKQFTNIVITCDTGIRSLGRSVESPQEMKSSGYFFTSRTWPNGVFLSSFTLVIIHSQELDF